MTEIPGGPNPSGPPGLGFLPRGLEGLDALTELALDMRWSWNHATDKVRRVLDPDCGKRRITPVFPADRTGRVAIPRTIKVTCLFLDIGGVPPTHGRAR